MGSLQAYIAHTLESVFKYNVPFWNSDIKELSQDTLGYPKVAMLLQCLSTPGPSEFLYKTLRETLSPKTM